MREENRGGAPSLLAGVLLITLLVAFPGSARPDDSESVPIADILADPEPYHLRPVTLQGKVRRIEVLEPYYQPSGSACYGAYRFTLEDGTGSLEIAVLGVCGVPVLRPPLVIEGDSVVVVAQIRATDRAGYPRRFDGSTPPQESLQAVQATAVDIRPADGSRQPEVPESESR
ncbi:MAG: OB-fold nucleic acid binding domain-containing protein [Nitrospiraceae bacterium]